MLKRHLQQSTLCILVPTYAPLYFLIHRFAPLKFVPKNLVCVCDPLLHVLSRAVVWE